MALSNKWNDTDNVYFKPAQNMYRKVEKCIINFALNNTRRDTLLFNNRLFLGIVNPTQSHKDQYSDNRDWILQYFN